VKAVLAWLRGSDEAGEEARKATEERRKEKFGNDAFASLTKLITDRATIWTWLGISESAEPTTGLPAPLAFKRQEMMADEKMWRYAVSATLWLAMHNEARERERRQPDGGDDAGVTPTPEPETV
jgi:hypothetical protein